MNQAGRFCSVLAGDRSDATFLVKAMHISRA